MSHEWAAAAHEVWVRINSQGIIVAAAVDDGTDAPVKFVSRAKGKGKDRVFRMPGPVRMSAHFTNPMVYPAQPLPQIDMPADAAKVLRDNLWELYDDSPSGQRE